MSIEYRTVDCMGNVYRVTDLRDQFDKPTTDPAQAECCIVHSMNQQYATTTDECPVYAVH